MVISHHNGSIVRCDRLHFKSLSESTDPDRDSERDTKGTIPLSFGYISSVRIGGLKCHLVKIHTTNYVDWNKQCSKERKQ